MANLTHKTTHWEETKALLIEQFKRSPNLLAILEAWITQVEELEAASYDLYTLRNVDDATGDALDALGAIVGEERNGLEDNDYRVLIKVRIRINISSGLESDIVDTFKMLLGDNPPMRITEAYPAEFVVELREYVDASPSVLAQVLHDVRSTAVAASLVYPVTTSAYSFTLSAATAVSASAWQGFSSTTASSIGGQLAGVTGA